MYEQVCYQKSFLKQVIARIDFASPIDKLDKTVPPKLVGVIVKDFPIIEPGNLFLAEIAVEGNDIKSKNTASKQWNYYSKERERQLTLEEAALYVQYKRYTTYEELREQFGSVVDGFGAAFPGTIASRFGLRYVNQIDLASDDPTKWSEYIDPKLLCSRDFCVAGEPIKRLITIVELLYGDITVRFQFGMPNPDYPAEIRRPLFVLDIDASVSQAFDLTEVMNHMDSAHIRVQDIFERSITTALREKMDAKPV